MSDYPGINELQIGDEIGFDDGAGDIDVGIIIDKYIDDDNVLSIDVQLRNYNDSKTEPKNVTIENEKSNSLKSNTFKWEIFYKNRLVKKQLKDILK